MISDHDLCKQAAIACGYEWLENPVSTDDFPVGSAYSWDDDYVWRCTEDEPIGCVFDPVNHHEDFLELLQVVVAQHEHFRFNEEVRKALGIPPVTGLSTYLHLILAADLRMCCEKALLVLGRIDEIALTGGEQCEGNIVASTGLGKGVS